MLPAEWAASDSYRVCGSCPLGMPLSYADNPCAALAAHDRSILYEMGGSDPAEQSPTTAGSVRIPDAECWNLYFGVQLPDIERAK